MGFVNKLKEMTITIYVGSFDMQGEKKRDLQQNILPAQDIFFANTFRMKSSGTQAKTWVVYFSAPQH